MPSDTALKNAGRDESSAQTRILAAAEELFADSGFHGTSLRQIALKAGVPVALVSYHFDGKIGVYRAIFELRTPVVVEQRKAGLALAALETDPERKLEMVIKAMLVPMLRLRITEGSNYFGTLLARETNDPCSVGRGIIQEMLDPVAREVIAQIGQILPDRSRAEINWAYQMIAGTMAYVMSDSGRIARLSDGVADPNDVGETIRHLVSLLMHGVGGSKVEQR